jgi:hypothetical protein
LLISLLEINLLLNLNLSGFLQTELTDLFVTNRDTNQLPNALLSLSIGPSSRTMNCNLLQARANIGFG